MGARGSKTGGNTTADKVDVQQQPPKAEAVGTGKEDQILSKPKATFEIRLEKEKDEESLGITLALPDETTLVVKTIKDAGTIVTYNRASPPDVQLRQGDYIVNVNGVSGDKDKMLDQIKNNKTLVLTVQRDSITPACQEATSIDTPGQSTEADKIEPAPDQEQQEGTVTETAATDVENKAADKIAEAPVDSEPGQNVLVDGAVEVAVVEEAKSSAAVVPVEPEEPVEQEGTVDDKGCQVCKGWFS